MKTALISGSSNKSLARKIARVNKFELIKTNISKFPNNEKRIRLLDSVKGKNVYIVQSMSPKPDEYLIELLLITDAAIRSGALEINLIIPWLGYSPQDKIFRDGEALSCNVIINILQTLKYNSIQIVDIHNELSLKDFNIKAINLSSMDLFVDYFNKRGFDKDTFVAVAVDKGSILRATQFSKKLGVDLAIFDKFRDKETGEVSYKSFSGDVNNRNVIAFDDYVSTGGTLIKSVEYLQELGAKSYYFCVSHVVVKKALPKMLASKVTEIWTTNSISLNFTDDKLIIIDISSLFNLNK